MSNRRKGHKAEREAVQKIASSFNLLPFDNREVEVNNAQVGTTRMFNPSLDARKIDIWFVNTLRFFRRFAIQIKKHVIQTKTTNNIDVTALFEMTPLEEDDFKVLLTKLCYKPNKNEMERGWFVTMTYEDWVKLVKMIDYEKLNSNNTDNTT